VLAEKLDDGHGLPPKGEPILAAAVASRCQVLLTRDIADFGHVIGRTLQGVAANPGARACRRHGC